jgi:hypothetical protein
VETGNQENDVWLDGYNLKKLKELYKKYEPINETADEQYKSYFDFSKQEYYNFEIFKNTKIL